MRVLVRARAHAETHLQLGKLGSNMIAELWLDAKRITKGQNLIGKHQKGCKNTFLLGFFNDHYLVRVKSKTVQSGSQSPGLVNGKPVPGPQHLAATVHAHAAALITHAPRAHLRTRAHVCVCTRIELVLLA